MDFFGHHTHDPLTSTISVNPPGGTATAIPPGAPGEHHPNLPVPTDTFVGDHQTSHSAWLIRPRSTLFIRLRA